MPVVGFVGYAAGNNSEVRANTPITDSFINNTRVITVTAEQSSGTISFPATADLAEGTGTRAFSAVNTQAGDWLVVEVLMENDANPNSNTSIGSSGLSFDLQNDTTVGTSTRARIFQWTTLDSVGGSRTITVTPNIASWAYRARITVVRGSNGPGGKGNTKTGQTVSVDRTGTGSAIFMAIADWSTNAVGSPVWTPGGSTVVSQQGSAATYLFGRWDNSGAPGTANHGISSPSYGTPSVAVLEMLPATGGGGPTEVFSDPIALTGQGTLSTSAISETTGSVVLSGQMTLTTAGTRVLNGSSVLSAQLGLAVVGNTSISGSTVLTGQSGLTVNGLVDVKATTTLNGQTSLSVIGTNTVRAATVLSSQSSLSTSAVNTINALAVLSGQSSLLTNAAVILTGSSVLIGQSTLTVTGNVGALPASANMTAQGLLSVVGSNTARAASVLNGQLTLTAVGQNTVRGSTVLNGQLSLVTVGQNTVRAASFMLAQSTLTSSGNSLLGAIQAVLSGQSTLAVSASVIRVGVANLSAVSSIAVSSTVTSRGASLLSAQSSLSVIGVRIVYSSTILNGQSTLQVAGFVPAIITGLAGMASQLTLVVNANTTPPWVFPYIEFQGSKVEHREGDSLVVVAIGESTTDLDTIIESKSTVSVMEGG